MMQSRRGLLVGGGAALTLAQAGIAKAAWEPATHYPDPSVEVIDPSFDKYRLTLVSVERIATGTRWAEGPTWFGDTRQLVFSDVSNNRMMRWDEETGRLYVMRQPSNFSNGNTRDRQGRLVTCEHFTQRVTRTEHDGTITVLVDKGPEGKPLNSPNDIVCKTDGTIWFTDPAFGPNMLEGMQPPTTAGRIYRYDPEAKKLSIIDEIRGPNGLCFSPDEKKLYVIESRATPHRLILVYDVQPNGTVSNRQTFYDCGDGTADGFRADVDGNLWCGWGMSESNDGVIIVNPDGKLIGRIRLPERCPNLVFGGLKRNRLLMCATKSIYALYVNTQGAVVGA